MADHYIVPSSPAEPAGTLRFTLAVTKGPEGVYVVAVPARSWKPVTVTVETHTRIRLG